MIRAGEMMFAEVLKRHLDAGIFIEKKIEIIKLFLDSESKAPFSIKKITDVSAKNFEVYPGEWFKATTIILSLEELYEEYIFFYFFLMIYFYQGFFIKKKPTL